MAVISKTNIFRAYFFGHFTAFGTNVNSTQSLIQMLWPFEYITERKNSLTNNL